ncbi:MAG: plastocyanin/azurin family copper-binding protein, partial [Thaumarchaeota archaeon]|nr:plastocyanin/azurin family copper-binding protein [Nitrososphaerota archaeon]
MKIRSVSPLFLLSVLVAGMIATTSSGAFAAHPNVMLEPLPGSATVGCERTDEGCYNMPILTVDPGTTITFSNTDNAAHTLTSGSPAEGMTGVFDSGLVMAGATYEFTIDEEGEYNHYCVVHPWMTGRIIVGTPAGQSASAQTAANNPDHFDSNSYKKQSESERDSNVYEEHFIRHDYGGSYEIQFMPNGSFTYDYASHGIDKPCEPSSFSTTIRPHTSDVG